MVEEVQVGGGRGLWGSGGSGRHLGVGPVDCLEWPLRSGSAAALHKSNCGLHQHHLCSFSSVRCFITAAGSLWVCVFITRGTVCVVTVHHLCIFIDESAKYHCRSRHTAPPWSDSWTAWLCLSSKLNSRRRCYFWLCQMKVDSCELRVVKSLSTPSRLQRN